jgi:hypothetical protein
MSYGSTSPESHYPATMPDGSGSLLAKPSLLRSGSAYEANLVDIPIEAMVPSNEASANRQVRLDILSENILCLNPVPSRPPWLSRLTYLCFQGCLLFMIYCGVQGIQISLERQKQDSVIMWAFFAGIPALILLGSLIFPFFKAGPFQYRFDRVARLMQVQRCYGLNKTPRLIATFAMDDVVGLQLLYRYYKALDAGITPEDFKKQSYEMNLVFRNVSPPRVNLAVHSDWRWMKQAGSRLAEFLEIQLIDQTGH